MKLSPVLGVVLSSLGLLSSLAAPPEGWQVRPAPTTNRLNSVAYGNGSYVAVGEQATVLISSNGFEWSPRSIGSGTSQLFSVAHGTGTFVAGGETTALLRSSKDGLNWTNGVSTAGLQQVRGIGYGNGLFVAVGNGPSENTSYVLTSVNAVDWTARSASTLNPLHAVTYANNLWVAVGEQGTIITSPNGTTWTVRREGAEFALRAVTHYQGRFISAGDAGIVVSSPDGITWSEAAPTAFNVYGFASDSDFIIAVGRELEFGRLHASEDGLSWPDSSFEFVHVLNGIARGPSSFVAVGNHGLIIQSEPLLSQATNSWIASLSGVWEEQFFWSLGHLPSPDHATVAVRNPGHKAVAISAVTTASYAYSLSIQNLVVDAPAGSSNLLLLNYAGDTVPLDVAGEFTLGPNGGMNSYSSSVRGGTFTVNGRAVLSERSQATFGQVRLGVRAVGELNLSNAWFAAQNLSLGHGVAGLMNQFGGTNQVDSLQVNASGVYRLRGGTLTASNIEITGGELHLAGGTVVQSGTLTCKGGLIRVETACELGRLRLATPSPATVDLLTGATSLHFRESRGLAWDSGATLIIQNWSGAVAGSGADRVYVGTSGQGLTASQLAQIAFINPAGLPSGNYPARILSNGELVPGPALSFTKGTGGLVISWTGAFQLFSATNVTGPYSLLTGVSNPHTNPFIGPRRFFQLRSSAP